MMKKIIAFAAVLMTAILLIPAVIATDDCPVYPVGTARCLGNSGPACSLAEPEDGELCVRSYDCDDEDLHCNYCNPSCCTGVPPRCVCNCEAEDPPPPPPPNSVTPYVFVTHATYSANLGGPAGAHEKCRQQAMEAGLHQWWKAWIATSYVTEPKNFLVHYDREYLCPDGSTKIADNWADLTDGSLDHAINCNQYGNTVTALSQFNKLAYTNTDADGDVQWVNYDCSDFTAEYYDPQGDAQMAWRGDITSTDDWFQGSPGYYGCLDDHYAGFLSRLYCFQQEFDGDTDIIDCTTEYTEDDYPNVPGIPNSAGSWTSNSCRVFEGCDTFDESGSYCCGDDEDETYINSICYDTRAEGSIENCEDGVDNNNNNYADCADTGCKLRTAGSVYADSDGDDWVDICESGNCANVETWQGSAQSENTLERCTDNMDNDCDGTIDYADADCRETEGADYNSDAHRRTCTDGYDNDADGEIDCEDAGCASNPPCLTEDDVPWQGHYFAIKNSGGDYVAEIGALGWLTYRGTLTENNANSCTSNVPDNSFVIENAGVVKAWFDSQGNVCLRGELSGEQDSISTASCPCFFIKDADGQIVAKISDGGDLYLLGYAFQTCDDPFELRDNYVTTGNWGALLCQA